MRDLKRKKRKKKRVNGRRSGGTWRVVALHTVATATAIGDNYFPTIFHTSACLPHCRTAAGS